jgi:cell division transport system permease protein
MFAHRTDLALERDSLGRFLPWLVAFMVYLAVLALAGALALRAVAERWETGVGATLTVQIPPTGNPARDAGNVEAVLGALRAIPEVARVQAIEESRLMALLEPWLGAASVGDLPIPRLIDVELKEGARLDLASLRARLSAIVPSVGVDDHRVWLERLVRLIQTAEAIAIAILVFIALATIGTVVFTTRTGLAIHREAIEVLHLIGAQDSYVARQFAERALALGLKGGLLGLALALPTLAGVGYVVRRLEGGVLPDLALVPAHWAALVVLPLVVAAIAMLTARFTVLRTLARML